MNNNRGTKVRDTEQITSEGLEMNKKKKINEQQYRSEKGKHTRQREQEYKLEGCTKKNKRNKILNHGTSQHQY